MIDITKKIGKAMKNKDSVAKKAWQNLKAEVQKYQTAKNAQLYDESAQTKILLKYCKTLEDAIAEFEAAGRKDLSAEYREELEVFKPYLPAPVDLDSVTDVFVEWCYEKGYIETHEIQSNGQHIWNPALPKAKIGEAMKFLRSKFPTFDGRECSELVKRYIV